VLFVDNQNINDPRINLALEEYMLRKSEISEDMLLFYINEPSIIIGRNQNTLEEINYDHVKENGIHVVRRLSGGGAVYHDLGNLNFSFITNNDGNNFSNFKKFTAPVIKELKKLGVEAELSGRNDILVDGRKISGNAQYSSRGRMFSHGTLLFDSHLEDVGAALNVKMSKIASKGIKSVRSRVANISEFLPEKMDILEFRQGIINGVFEGESAVPTYQFTDEDWEGIHQLTEKRYGNWDWNFGKSPDFNIQKTHRFPIGEIDARIDVQDGLISSIKIFGDFLGNGDLVDIESRLIGAKYEPDSLEAALAEMEVPSYFGGLSNGEFIQFLF
jgi:lipoate-protein ligase A